MARTASSARPAPPTDPYPLPHAGAAPETSPRAVTLRAVDARMCEELAIRRVMAARARATGRIAARLVVDASVVAGVAALVRAAGDHAAGGHAAAAAGGAPSVVTALLVALLALAAAGEYGLGTRRHHALATPLVACALLAVVLPVLAADGARAWEGRSLVALVAAIGGTLLVVVAVRRRLARQAADPHVALRGALLVGRERDLAGAIAALDESAAAHVDDRLALVGPLGSRAMVRQLTRRLAAGDVHEVLVVSPMRAISLRALAAACWQAGVRCFVAFEGRDVRIDAGLPATVGGCATIEVVPTELRLPRLLVKRVVDVAVTAMLLPIAVPIALVVGVAIRLESPGPVLYRQRRVGLGGREFVIWKFRSMRSRPTLRHDDLAHLNDYGQAPLFKLKDDPRITRVGRILRRTSLDELPQLFNVLRGEMSLVGPRPPLPDEVARYASHHYVRLTVVPGMTGPWQVGGRNLITDFEEIVRMERRYIDEWSLALDLRIMARTVGVVIAGTGAY